jgi:FAD/FMN-containing dehydrogenase
MEDSVGESEQPVRDAYGSNYPRLAALKKRFDPTNFLTGNQNIKPSA